MVLMMNEFGNVYKHVSSNRVDDMLRKGFIICEDNGGGETPPPAPLQDDKQDLQEVLKEIEPDENEPAIEPVKVVRTDNPIILENGLYLTQVNTKPKLAQAFKELGIEYDYKTETREQLLKKRDEYIAQWKANKRL